MSSLKPIVPETSNLHGTRFEPLVAPKVLLAELPITRTVATTVLEGRRAVGQILAGRDPRLLVVVGPCSIHDPVAALEYAGRLARLRRDLAGTLCLVMRVYFEKPRTTVGWKGLINDPHLDGTRDMQHGRARVQQEQVQHRRPGDAPHPRRRGRGRDRRGKGRVLRVERQTDGFWTFRIGVRFDPPRDDLSTLFKSLGERQERLFGSGPS